MPLIRSPEDGPEGCCAPVNGQEGISLTTVRSRLLGPDGRPMGGREVVAVLRAAPNWMSDGSGRVVERAVTRTDAKGWWTLRLLPNRYLEPPRDEEGVPVPTSYYEFKEEGLVSTAVVPAPGEHADCPDPAAECTVFLRDILIDPPQPGPVPWHPIDTLGRLHNVDRGADQAQPGQALLFDGTLWAPGAVASTLGALGNVDPEADEPVEGQALVYEQGAWRAVMLPGAVDELVLLSDMHPSIHQAEPGDALIAVERDGSTGRLLWGVDRDVPQLSMRLGGASGSMTVIGLLDSPEVADKQIEVFWHGTLEGPRTVIDVGEYQTEHTYTEAGTYTIAYRYVDQSDSGADQITVPLP